MRYLLVLSVSLLMAACSSNSGSSGGGTGGSGTGGNSPSGSAGKILNDSEIEAKQQECRASMGASSAFISYTLSENGCTTQFYTCQSNDASAINAACANLLDESYHNNCARTSRQRIYNESCK